MAVRLVEFSSGRYKIKGNYWILRIGLMGRCQKLGSGYVNSQNTAISLKPMIFFDTNQANFVSAS
jgi:hypothetical protein